jgi:hypothetical protein
MSQRWTVVLALARRSLAARLAIPLAVGGAWLYLYGSDPVWIGHWTDMSLNLQAFQVIIIGPAIAAACCWDLARARRPGAIHDVALRSFASDALARMGSGLLWDLVVIAIVTTAASVRNASASHAGLPECSVLAVGLAINCTQLALALALTVALPALPAVGVFLVVDFVALLLQSQQVMTVGPRRFFPLIDELWDPSAVPLRGRLALAAVWCAALGVAVICGAGWLTRRPTRLAPTFAAALLAVSSGFGVYLLRPTSAESYFSAVRPISDRVCRAAGPRQVCVWSRDRHQLPLLTSGLAAAVGASAGVIEVPLTVREQGISPGTDGTSLELALGTAPRSSAEVTEMLLQDLTPEPAETCTALWNASAVGGFPAQLLVETVLLHRAGLPSAVDRPIAVAAARVEQLDRPAQDAWLRAALRAISTCTPLPDLPG